MRAFVSKHWLTEGVREVDGEEGYGGCLNVYHEDGSCPTHYKPHEWHQTRAEAVKRACRLINAKVIKLEAEKRRLYDLRTAISQPREGNR